MESAISPWGGLEDDEKDTGCHIGQSAGCPSSDQPAAESKDQPASGQERRGLALISLPMTNRNQWQLNDDTESVINDAESVCDFGGPCDLSVYDYENEEATPEISTQYRLPPGKAGVAKGKGKKGGKQNGKSLKKGKGDDEGNRIITLSSLLSNTDPEKVGEFLGHAQSDDESDVSEVIEALKATTENKPPPSAGLAKLPWMDTLPAEQKELWSRKVEWMREDIGPFISKYISGLHLDVPCIMTFTVRIKPFGILLEVEDGVYVIKKVQCDSPAAQQRVPLGSILVRGGRGAPVTSAAEAQGIMASEPPFVMFFKTPVDIHYLMSPFPPAERTV
jgi:hypothetical protein